MVFQSYALYPHMNVADNMSYSLRLRKAAEGEDRGSGRQRRRQARPRHRCWSGGRRRCPAASASASPWAAPSCAQPKAFLFDEPLSNLDARLREQMRAEIKKLHRDLGATSIYVTHDQIEAMTLADRIVAMHGGVVQQVGSAARSLRPPGQPVRRRLHRLAGHEFSGGAL